MLELLFSCNKMQFHIIQLFITYTYVYILYITHFNSSEEIN